MKIYDVVIVGAGPVGLATAIGLYARGIKNILVIDRTRAFRRVGQNIDLLPNGLKALKYIDLNTYEAVKEAGFKQPKSNSNWKKPQGSIVNCQGRQIRSFALEYDDWFQMYGEGRKSIGWNDLQTALRKQLPSDLVIANRRCINLSEESDYVRVDCLCNAEMDNNPYAYWQDSITEEENKATEAIERSVGAKLVIAADGINSTIRQIIYRDTPDATFAKPEYSGFAAITSSGIEVPNYLANNLETTFLRDNSLVTILNNKIPNNYSPKMILFGSGRTFGYILHLQVSRQDLKDKSGRELIELTLKELKAAQFPDNLRELVAKSPEYRIGHRFYYIHRATISDSISLPIAAEAVQRNINEGIDPAWHRGRVVLVGDAAHGMPPFTAQGANQGLEDAAVIANLISNLAAKNNWDDTEAIRKVFLKYDRIRRPTLVKVQQATLKHHFSLSESEKQNLELEIFSRNLEREITALV